MKSGKVIQVIQYDDSTRFPNYRPTSVLPCIPNSFKSYVQMGFLNFIATHILYARPLKHLRKSYSASLALIQLINNVSSAIDRNELTIRNLVDLSKAFDTVTYSTLFDIMAYVELHLIG